MSNTNISFQDAVNNIKEYLNSMNENNQVAYCLYSELFDLVSELDQFAPDTDVDSVVESEETEINKEDDGTHDNTTTLALPPTALFR